MKKKRPGINILYGVLFALMGSILISLLDLKENDIIKSLVSTASFLLIISGVINLIKEKKKEYPSQKEKINEPNPSFKDSNTNRKIYLISYGIAAFIYLFAMVYTVLSGFNLMKMKNTFFCWALAVPCLF